MADYTIFNLMDDMDRAAKREAAAKVIAQMPDFEKYFLLGLLDHEEREHGREGIEHVIAWLATREEEDE